MKEKQWKSKENERTPTENRLCKFKDVQGKFKENTGQQWKTNDILSEVQEDQWKN